LLIYLNITVGFSIYGSNISSVSYEKLFVLVIDYMARARKFAQNTLFRLRFDSNKLFFASNSIGAMNIIIKHGIKKDNMIKLIELKQYFATNKKNDT
jgi:hypothetical protein